MNDCEHTKLRQSSASLHSKLPQSYVRIPKRRNGRETTEKQLKTVKNSAKKTG